MFLSDPSYVFGEKSYKQICDDMEGSVYKFYPDINLHVFETKYGDGLYPIMDKGEQIGEIFVDTGMLCCGPSELIEKELKGPLIHMMIYNFPDDKVKFISEGDFYIGKYFINTSNKDTVSAKYVKENGKHNDKVAYNLSVSLANSLF